MIKLISILFICCHLIYAAPQLRMRTIENTKRESGPEPAPVEIVGLRVGNAAVKQNVAFVAGDDWISELETTIKNRSQSTITNLVITFEMPSNSQFANIPIAWLGGQCNYAATPSSISIKPDETITIKFNKDEQVAASYKKWRKTMADNGISSIEQVRPIIDGVLFEDGRRWSRGYFLKKNSDDSKRWDVIR